MRHRFLLTTILLSAALAGGASKTQRKPGSAAKTVSPLPVVFEDITERSGVHFRNEASHTSQKYSIETMEGGVALLDYDGDGRLDIYLVNGAALNDPMRPGDEPRKSDPRFWNRLFHNNGNLTFTDVTEDAGVKGLHYGMGTAVGDYDNDGHPDLFVTNYGSNLLFRNQGNGTFVNVTSQARVAGGGWSTSAAFVDYDRDGWLDLIVARYVEWDFQKNPWCGLHKPGYRAYCHPDHFNKTASLVYHNNRDGTFTEVSQKSGIAAKPGKALGLAFNDFDLDGWPDLLVANDEVPQQLFRNNQDGTFTETAALKGVAHDEDGHYFAGMGVDFQDYDNDGWPDVFVNALADQKYALYANRQGLFDYVSGQSGIAGITLQHSGWGARFLDYDNDGWKDIFVSQGHVMDNIQLTHPAYRYTEPFLLARNFQGKFQDVSSQTGPALAVPRAGRGAAFGDLDNDGNVDVVINCNNEPAVVLRNRGSSEHHWLLIDLRGTTSNRDGVGSKLHLTGESGFEQYSLATTAGSYLSASDRRVHFGLGADKTAKALEITWPSGTIQRLSRIPADQVLKVEEPRQARP